MILPLHKMDTIRRIIFHHHFRKKPKTNVNLDSYRGRQNLMRYSMMKFFRWWKTEFDQVTCRKYYLCTFLRGAIKKFRRSKATLFVDIRAWRVTNYVKFSERLPFTPPILSEISHENVRAKVFCGILIFLIMLKIWKRSWEQFRS